MHSTSSEHARVVSIPDWEETVAPTESWLRQAARRYLRNAAAMASLLFMLVTCLVAIFAPLLTPYDPTLVSIAGPHPLIDALPTHAHLLGTDSLGRDIYSRVLYGLRGPLAVGIIGAIFCTVIGSILGVLAGLHGGWIDEILVRITELIFVVPGFLLIVLCLALFGNALNGIFGPYGRLILITAFIATDSWPVIMRLARGEALQLRESQFVEAATVAGSSSWTIVIRHLIPNMLGVILVQGSFLVGGFVYVTAALSIFGLGIPVEWPDIGGMLIDGTSVFQLNAWELIVPATLITLLTIAPTFVGDGLRDAFDARAQSTPRS